MDTVVVFLLLLLPSMSLSVLFCGSSVAVIVWMDNLSDGASTSVGVGISVPSLVRPITADRLLSSCAPSCIELVFWCCDVVIFLIVVVDNDDDAVVVVVLVVVLVS